MKRIVIAMVLVLALAIGANAQDEGTGLTGKGIKFGLNIANATGKDAGGVGSRMGFGGGIFLTYNFTPAIGIQPEVMYMMKGVEEDMMGVTMTWSADYIEIPILFKYTIPTQGNVKPCFFAGPAVGLLMGSKIKVEYQGTTYLDWDVKDGLKSTDFGIAIGGGMVYQMTSMALTFDIRYTLGMTKYIDYEEFIKLEPPEGEIEIEPYGEGDPDVKNANISFMVGLSF
jgi:hypothetical protein